MIVETKFGIKDNVFIIHREKIVGLNVDGIRTSINCIGVTVQYTLNDKNYNKYEAQECKVYGSRQEAGEAWLEQNGLEVGIR